MKKNGVDGKSSLKEAEENKEGLRVKIKEGDILLP